MRPLQNDGLMHGARTAQHLQWTLHNQDYPIYFDIVNLSHKSIAEWWSYAWSTYSPTLTVSFAKINLSHEAIAEWWSYAWSMNSNTNCELL